jgi:hypothetical protein
MKALLIALSAALLTTLATAQAPAPKKPANKLAPSAQKAVEEVTPIDDDPDLRVSPAELEVAKQVHVGEMPCELGATVNLRPARREGLFVLTTRGHRFLMHPVESRTGAIRLEDPKRGAIVAAAGQQVHADEPEAGPAPGRRVHEPRPAGGGMKPCSEPGTELAGAPAGFADDVHRQVRTELNRPFLI